MIKKIILALSLLLGAEGLLVLSLVSVFASWDKAPSARPDATDHPVLSGELVVPQKLTLSSPDRFWIMTAKELLAFGPLRVTISPSAFKPAGLNAYFLQTAGATMEPLLTNPQTSPKIKGLELNERALGQYLLSLAQEINRAPVDAELVLEEDLRATHFIPHRDGQILNLHATRSLLKQALLAEAAEVNLPLQISKPKVKLGDLNNLGIRELLGTGQSDFTGSSLSRIQNIKAGAARYQGLILKSGEEFAFNKYLGPIDAKHGFLPELVIKPEGTVPEFGGGLCQVSTTAFRAAFFAGLPVTQRRNHSYAVRYYEWISDDVPRAVGLDATIYPGAQDMKFVNDTPGAILIWTRVEGKKLYFDFYGTPDGRKVMVDGPHPYDRKSDGSVKSKITRTVIPAQGEVQEVTFNSRYVSPNLYPKIYEYPPPQTNNQ